VGVLEQERQQQALHMMDDLAMAQSHHYQVHELQDVEEQGHILVV
jgi:hypothetical protein